MATPAASSPRERWIANAATDLLAFGWGWIPLYLALLWSQSNNAANWGAALLLGVLAVNFVHRHLTFPLVYGEPATFRQRKWQFTYLPVGFAVVTVISILYVRPARVETLPIRDVNSTSSNKDFIPHPTQKRPLILRWSDGTGDSQELRLALSKRPESFEQLAEKLQTKSKGILSVASHEDRLQFTLLQNDADSWFRFKGKKSLLREFGLPNREIRKGEASRPLFIALLVLSVVWTIYHSLMQKLGILRIYTRQRSAQYAHDDRVLVFGWFGTLVLALASDPSVHEVAASQALAGRILVPIFEAMAPFAKLAAATLGGYSAFITIRYAYRESQHPDGFHAQKWYFILSIWSLYAAIAWNLVAGYIAFGFSHATEYIAFVYVFVQKKYTQMNPRGESLLARWAAVPKRSALCYAALMLVPFALAHESWPRALNWYIVGSSFLHFLYDGWIWKVRRPAVARDLGLTPHPLPSMTSS